MFCSSAANLCSHHNMQASADTKNALKQDSVNTLQVKGFCNNTTYPASCLVSESKAADLRARAHQSMVPNHSGFCLVHSLQLLHEPIVRHRSDLHTCIYENQSPRGKKRISWKLGNIKNHHAMRNRSPYDSHFTFLSSFCTVI